MKGAKKHFSRALTLLLSVLIMLQTVTVPAFAAENATENVEVATNDASTEEESTFNLIKADVQIDDEYGNETDYISEVQIPDLEQISEETLVENGVSIHSDYPGDAMVYLTQRWLNQEYGNVPGFGYVTEDGRTGWDTVYGLTRALQVELGITDLADNFGPTTERLYRQNLLRRQDGVTNRKFAILQGALWCKGYNPGYNLSETEDGTVVFNGVFDADVEKAIIELKEDAGLINPDGVVTVNIMKALMSMDSFKLLSSYGGTEAVREMQQKLNRKYEAYTGITPCDGVYGRNTNRALIYALQAEEGMPTDVANANFGVTTRLCCPEIPYARNSSSARRYPGTSSGSYYSAAQITAIAELLQFALLVNGHSAGAIDGEYGDATRQALYDFQEDMKITPTGYADKTTWLSLFISCGDTSRSALAADCATQLTAAKAKTLYDNGYRYIGRYLTGNNKKITRSEAQIIFDAGLKFFPIYQSSANYLEYFTPQQGADDAQKAKKAATELGLPENTIIYFAVDFDCLDYQITNNVIPYFERVHSEMADSGYRVGIYGTRNACMRVSNLGYAYSSFVGDMSTGFSGNLGFKMPSNWAFDQFVTTTIGSGNGEIEIDKDGYSGYDPAVSRLNDISSAPSPENLFAGNSANDEVVGPTVDILGYQIPLFKLNVGLEVKDIVKMEVEFDQQENAYKVLIGVTKESLSTEITGGSTRSGKFKEYYREAKTTLSLIGKNNDVSGEASSYYFLIETEELESDCGNNSEFVYLYPDYDITLIAGTGGNVSGGGTYVKGDDAILIATPSSGYIFDGWYENGERLYGVSNECKITVDSNRTLEARFKKNDLQITDVEIFGTLSARETISFTVSATGGVQPWQWEFYIQSDNEVVYSDNAAIVNFTEWTPSQSGTYDFLAFVTDATGKRISYRTQFVVS